jgi:histidinol dehydrogenase
VLPTGGSARHTAGLSVLPFLRLVNVIECDQDALGVALPHIEALGAAEDLPAHVAAVRARFDQPPNQVTDQAPNQVTDQP